MALVLLVGVVTLDVVGVVLVDAVVTEVHARVPQVLAGGIVPDLMKCRMNFSKFRAPSLAKRMARGFLNSSSAIA